MDREKNITRILALSRTDDSHDHDTVTTPSETASNETAIVSIPPVTRDQIELKAAFRNHAVIVDSGATSTFSNPQTNIAVLSKNLFKLSDEKIGISLFGQIGNWQKQTGFFEHPSAVSYPI